MVPPSLHEQDATLMQFSCQIPSVWEGQEVTSQLYPRKAPCQERSEQGQAMAAWAMPVLGCSPAPEELKRCTGCPSLLRTGWAQDHPVCAVLGAALLTAQERHRSQHPADGRLNSWQEPLTALQSQFPAERNALSDTVWCCQIHQIRKSFCGLN